VATEKGGGQEVVAHMDGRWRHTTTPTNNQGTRWAQKEEEVQIKTMGMENVKWRLVMHRAYGCDRRLRFVGGIHNNQTTDGKGDSHGKGRASVAEQRDGA